MSVSKKTLQEAHIALLDNGQIALVDQTKTGNLRIHRVIRREEVVNIIKVFFIQYQHDHPDAKVMQLPYTEDQILAMALLDTPKEK